MSFNAASFSFMAYGGNAGSIWQYASADNLASLCMGNVNAGYFSTAWTAYALPVKQGDIILFSNQASPVSALFQVTDNWDDNGASVCRMAGPHFMKTPW